MAKKDKKKKNSNASLLPKRIAGVKIPKALRKQGHHLIELARHPMIADVVAAGIVALAASVRDKAEGRSGDKDAPKKDDPPAAVPAEAAANPEPAPEAAPKQAKSASARRPATRAAPDAGAAPAAPKPAPAAKPGARKPAAKGTPSNGKPAPRRPRKPTTH